VAVNYRRDAETARTVVDGIRERGGRAIPVEADISDRAAVASAFAAVERELGRAVDLLVNNASAPFTPKPFAELDWSDVENLFDVQIRGAFHCAQAALPGMLAAKSGAIVNIGSILTSAPPPAQWTAFVMAKAALAGMTRSLASEYGPQGIRVNLVSPGTTATDSIGGLPERLRKVQAMQTPLRRLAEADDVAKAVVFLCSEAAGFLTGVDLPVCGGISL
jgi:3-oxoacyl-[acyl-carrier protein] reductase